MAFRTLFHVESLWLYLSVGIQYEFVAEKTKKGYL